MTSYSKYFFIFIPLSFYFDAHTIFSLMSICFRLFSSHHFWPFLLASFSPSSRRLFIIFARLRQYWLLSVFFPFFLRLQFLWQQVVQNKIKCLESKLKEISSFIFGSHSLDWYISQLNLVPWCYCYKENNKNKLYLFYDLLCEKNKGWHTLFMMFCFINLNCLIHDMGSWIFHDMGPHPWVNNCVIWFIVLK